MAGQVAVNAEGEVVGRGDLREQTRQVFENVQTALAAAGATFSDVVKVTMYIANYKPEDRGVIMEVRGQYFTGEHLPTSVLLGVQSLATSDLLIEMDAIAVVD
jgi:enamine deaminase RidA (YjgF/YER057c/UK114 family)